jgi:hypothetical protein
MNIKAKDIQLQYEGYLNTPQLWNNNIVFGLTQLKIPKTTHTKFNTPISNNLRLGKLVERFVKNEFEQIPSIKILAENIQIQRDKITVGEIDCIIQKQEIPIHIEVVYKFYLYDETVGDTELAHWVGPNKRDSLIKKLTKLKEKQLPLIFRSETTSLIKKLNIEIVNLEQKVLFKAQLFIPFNKRKKNFKLINNECVIGFYIPFNKLLEFKNYKFYIPTKVNWLQKIQIQSNWKTYQQILPQIKNFIEKETSPLCWVKQPNGEVFKFFIVWW